MKSSILFFLNPLNWFRAWRFHRNNKKFDKSTYDLELYLYSKILKNDMLHYGYFENADIHPETISLQQLEDAQVRYAENIIELISDKYGLILDVGCGMGGLSAMLLGKGFKTEALTPNENQYKHILEKFPALKCHHTKFENFSAEKKYTTILNSESLQYIKLDEAFSKADALLKPGGKWIIADYFRLSENAANNSGHLLAAFENKVAVSGWKIVHQQDITLNILPTLKYVYMYVERFLFPLKHFALEKLRYKKAWLYFLTQKAGAAAEIKMEKELLAVKPGIFARDKKYLLFVIEKK